MLQLKLMPHPRTIPERLGHAPEHIAATNESLDRPRKVVLQVDEHLHKLHQYGLALLTSRNQIPDYSEEIATLRGLLDQTLEEAILHPKGIRWSEYYNLLNREVFLEELAYAPLLLGEANTPEERIYKFTDGIYGLNVHLLADALERYDHSATRSVEKSHLRGIINELTAVALLNRRQEFGHIALPAHHIADASYKTDCIYYHRTDGVPYATNIQVKSSTVKGYGKSRPQNGILILASRMGNADNLQTSRAIVAELYQENTDDNQMAHLEAEHTAFIQYVTEEIAARNARGTPQHASMLGMSAAITAE